MVSRCFAFILVMLILLRDIVWGAVYYLSGKQIISPTDSGALKIVNLITLFIALLFSIYSVYSAEKLPTPPTPNTATHLFFNISIPSFPKANSFLEKWCNNN